MVFRTNGVSGVEPMAPNSKTCTSWGAWMRWARMAATWGMPKPMNAVFWSSSRRAHWAIMNSASVNVRALVLIERPVAATRSRLVAFLDGRAAAERRQALEPHALLEHLFVGRHRVDVHVEVLGEAALALE